MAELNGGAPNPADNAGAGGDNSNPNGGGAPGGDKPVAGAGGTGGDGKPAGGEKVYTFKEDRSDWTPRTRLNEVSGKLTAAEQRAIAAETALEAERKRTRALAGVDPQDPDAAKTEEVRNELYRIFPHLKALESLTKEQLDEIREAAQLARSTSQAQWDRHSNAMWTDLESEAANVIGVEKLSPTQQKQLRGAYRAEAAAAFAEREQAARRGERQTLQSTPADTDFLARHERGDKTLVKEFVKAFLDDWFEPARRSVTTSLQRRTMRPVPRGERTRTMPAGTVPKVDLNNKDEFKKALLAARGQSE